jgi:prolyl oligopeptidase
LLPGYYPDFVEFADAGGLFVLVNPRGGSEYGWDWWQAGRFDRKQTNFDDIYAVAEDLVARGLSTPDLMSFVGQSNGGLLAGVVLTQRPDLIGTVVPMVPLLDLMRVDRDPWTAAVVYIENGNIHDPAEAPMVYAYSPYHNVREGVAYPATLLIAGETDVRVPPWHARKMAAALQHASTSGQPVLLRVLGNTGHMSGLSLEDAGAATAEWLGFVMRQAGMSL